MKDHAMRKLKCLDLFCCAGGAGMGYHQAGFEVVGVDNQPQPRYPFTFIQGDALEIMMKIGHEFDFIHASPPCQFGSVLTPKELKPFHPNLIPAVRHRLMYLAKPYIIENVAGSRAYLENPVMLCGSMFGLPIWRHRYFENNLGLFFSPASCIHNFEPILISGAGTKMINGKRRKRVHVDIQRKAIGIDWMTKAELEQAIPPVFTHWVGQQAINYLAAQAA
jgi:DNA (cytosine-5)-methyltransferase 1